MKRPDRGGRPAVETSEAPPNITRDIQSPEKRTKVSVPDTAHRGSASSTLACMGGLTVRSIRAGQEWELAQARLEQGANMSSLVRMLISSWAQGQYAHQEEISMLREENTELRGEVTLLRGCLASTGSLLQENRAKIASAAAVASMLAGHCAALCETLTVPQTLNVS